MPRKLLTAIFLTWFSLAQGQPAGTRAQLQFALIVTRHGVRSPTWAPERLNEYSASTWPAYFWADTDQRTLKTGRALAEGLLPGCKAEVHSYAQGKSRMQSLL